MGIWWISTLQKLEINLELFRMEKADKEGWCEELNKIVVRAGQENKSYSLLPFDYSFLLSMQIHYIIYYIKITCILHGCLSLAHLMLWDFKGND